MGIFDWRFSMADLELHDNQKSAIANRK